MTNSIEVKVTTMNIPVTVLKHIDAHKTRYTSRTDIIIEAVEDWLDKKSPDGFVRTNPPIKEPSKWLVSR